MLYFIMRFGRYTTVPKLKLPIYSVVYKVVHETYYDQEIADMKKQGFFFETADATSGTNASLYLRSREAECPNLS